MKLGRKAPHGNDYPAAADLAAMLAACRASWLPAFYPAGKLAGGMFYLGSAAGEPGRSFPIPLRGHPRLIDFAGDFRGDDLALLGAAIGAGDDMGAAFKEAIAYLGLGRTSAPRPAPAKAAAPPVQHDRNRELARTIWRQTVRIRRDRLALDYLVCRRGITAWDDDRLRWHPQCPWDRERVGCIVAPVVCHRTGYTVAIWRIRPTMEGPVERRGLGPCRHNFAPVCATTGDELALTEGCEDALAFYQQHGVPTWAALSSTNMAALVLPDRLRRIVVCADNDAAGHAGAQRLAARMRREGREVRIIASDHGKDANDALRRAVS